MKAKKVLSAALLLALSTAMLITPVSANEAKDYRTAKAIELSQTLELKELTGTIKEIKERELIVEDADGKEYIVPILGFKELEEYKTANLQVGDEIELKGHGPLLGGRMAISSTIELKEGEGVLEFREAELEKGFKHLPRLTFSREIDGAVLTIEGEAIAAEAIEVIRVGKLSELDIERLQLEANAEAITVKDGEEGIKVTVYGRSIEAGEIPENQELGLELSVAEAIDAEGLVSRVTALRSEAAGELFIANEITVKGITMKLSDVVKVRTATRPIK